MAKCITRTINSNGDAVLAAISDPAKVAARSVADRYGAQIRDVEAIAEADDIDAVVLCTPTDLHAQQIELFASAGKAVFCEKPIDPESERVRACLDVVNETGTPPPPSWLGSTGGLIHFMGVKAAIRSAGSARRRWASLHRATRARRQWTTSPVPVASSRT